MKIRLRADVPLAFCLSGGVDSNSLIAIARRLCNFDVHGFTIINTDARYDEREMVEESVRDLDLHHTAIPISREGFLDKLRGLIRQHDAPVYTATYYVQWQLMREIAAAGYRVSISGTGADELFSGYYDHHNFYLNEVHQDASRYAAALSDWHAHVGPVVRNRYLKDPEVFIKTPQERGHIFLDAEEFGSYLKIPWSEPFAERVFTNASILRNRMLNELFYEIVPPICTRTISTPCTTRWRTVRRFWTDSFSRLRYVFRRDTWCSAAAQRHCCATPSRTLRRERLSTIHGR